MENAAISFGISIAAALAVAVLLSIYRRATSTDLVERIASIFFPSTPSSAQGNTGGAQ